MSHGVINLTTHSLSNSYKVCRLWRPCSRHNRRPPLQPVMSHTASQQLNPYNPISEQNNVIHTLYAVT